MSRHEFTNEQRSRGGKHPASELQKLKAKIAIERNKPWKHSTGATTERGKAIASLNAWSGWKCVLSESDPDFEAKSRKLEETLKQLKRLAEKGKLDQVVEGAKVKIRFAFRTQSKKFERAGLLIGMVSYRVNLQVCGTPSEVEKADPIAQEKFREVDRAIAAILGDDWRGVEVE